MQTISSVAEKIKEILAPEFTESITLGGKLARINANDQSFVIGDENGMIFFCRAKTSVNHLVVGDNLILIGHIKFDSAIYISVSNFYTITEGEKFQGKKKAYDAYRTNILSDKYKYKKKMASVTNAKYPGFVKNVGLIVIDAHQQMSDKFTTEFRSKCHGNLWIYNLKKETLGHDLTYALDYMGRYSDIDVVCIVMDHMNLQDILEISSFENIRYIFGRKNYPYLMTVSDSNKTDRIIECLANKHFKTVSECINFIATNQDVVRVRITDAIERAKANALQIIQTYQDEIAMTEEKYSERLLEHGVDLQVSVNKTIFDKLKAALLEKIAKQIQELDMNKKSIVKNLLKDPEIDAHFEKVLNEEKELTTFDLFSVPIKVNESVVMSASDKLFFDSFSPIRHCGVPNADSFVSPDASPEANREDSADEIIVFKRTPPEDTIHNTSLGSSSVSMLQPTGENLFPTVAQNITTFNTMISEETKKAINFPRPIELETGEPAVVIQKIFSNGDF